VTSRIEPLRAAPRPPDAESPPPPIAGDDAGRFQQLADGIRELRVGASRKLTERTLMFAASIAAGLGLCFIVLGWYGAAHTPNLYEQIPYVASGGFLGLAFVFLGAFFYFAHWLTELVKEGRAQSAAVVEAIGRLEETVRQQAGQDRYVAASNGSSVRPAEAALAAADEQWNAEPERELVATTRGSMAHRAECVVVGGKPGLRRVTAADALQPCKLCDPYGDA
jgi:hypothetical protein